MKKLPVIPKFVSENLTNALFAAIAVLLAIGGYGYWFLHSKNVNLQNKITELEQSLEIKKTELANSKEENEELKESLSEEQIKVGNLGEQVDMISDTVGVLDKLSKTDEELLQKYSKIYFLNEHYVPKKLTDISAEYLYSNSQKNQQIHTDVWPYLESLLKDSAKEDVYLQIISAYRSFREQSSLKSTYSFIYGAGTANQFSADQGYSEHQLGTTVDFTTPSIGTSYSKEFVNTSAYEWLLENAYKYGFTLSYPEGNSYYVFEPWHWRFVGVDLARNLHSDGKNFYDVSQREIDKYLVSIFD